MPEFHGIKLNNYVDIGKNNLPKSHLALPIYFTAKTNLKAG